MLCFCGCDCSGKSTLMHAVVNRFTKMLSDDNGYGGCRVQHFGILRDDFDYFFDYLENISVDTFSDRFVFSELVYGPLFRTRVHPRLTDTRLDMLMMELFKTGSLVVYCRPGDDVLQERYLKKKGGDSVIDGGVTQTGIDNICRISKGFDALNFGVSTLRVDNDGPIENLVDTVLNTWLPIRQRALDYEKITTENGWGSLTPEICLVGERPNRSDYIKRLGFWPRPFAGAPKNKQTTGVANSSDWVFSLMRKSGLAPSNTHVLNAYSSADSDKTTLVEQLEFLRPQKIVVMGNKARELVVDEYNYDTRVPVLHIRHPQYLRRFHNKDIDKYAMIIRDFVGARMGNGLIESLRD